MSIDLSKFKNKSIGIDKLVEAANADSKDKKQGDPRFWRPTVDKAGNGYAVIRFLPSSGDSELPWTRFWDHAFQGPTGQWLIEKSLTSLGQDCPISEANSILWNSGSEQNKSIARDRKRRLHYVSNIMVVSDPSNPENEGKVFLYSFGKKIFDKIMEAMNPQFQDEAAMNPFDMWEGADFKLKIRQVEGWRNYDKSEFVAPSTIYGGDEDQLGTLVEKLHDLDEFTDPAQYKSYDELKAQLNRVLGESSNTPSQTADLDKQEPEMDDIPFESNSEMPSQSAEESNSQEVEDAVSYFQKAAAGE